MAYDSSLCKRHKLRIVADQLNAADVLSSIPLKCGFWFSPLKYVHDGGAMLTRKIALARTACCCRQRAFVSQDLHLGRISVTRLHPDTTAGTLLGNRLRHKGPNRSERCSLGACSLGNCSCLSPTNSIESSKALHLFFLLSQGQGLALAS